jgi:hypothetical protein
VLAALMLPAMTMAATTMATARTINAIGNAALDFACIGNTFLMLALDRVHTGRGHFREDAADYSAGTLRNS